MDYHYISYFKMQAIKVDNSPVETYSDEELKILLEKPNIKKRFILQCTKYLYNK